MLLEIPSWFYLSHTLKLGVITFCYFSCISFLFHLQLHFNLQLHIRRSPAKIIWWSRRRRLWMTSALRWGAGRFWPMSPETLLFLRLEQSPLSWVQLQAFQVHVMFLFLEFFSESMISFSFLYHLYIKIKRLWICWQYSWTLLSVNKFYTFINIKFKGNLYFLSKKRNI